MLAKGVVKSVQRGALSLNMTQSGAGQQVTTVPINTIDVNKSVLVISIYGDPDEPFSAYATRSVSLDSQSITFVLRVNGGYSITWRSNFIFWQAIEFY